MSRQEAPSTALPDSKKNVDLRRGAMSFLFSDRREPGARMKLRSRMPRLSALLFLAVALYPNSGSEAQAPCTVSGRVLGASGRHTLYVALWDEKSFLQHPVQQVAIRPGDLPVFHFTMQPRRWALSAFEDQNSNGVLDMGLFGPKEPSGFWHPFHAWRKPHFSDVAASIESDVRDADIHLGR
jgi:uncharacterized protein (DUF2141 family)